ncbi:MAG: DUF1835 domain-containing protein [Alphaproteobacteria bacterium]|nr:DUF1835 domain-containing protein [Alphaproteobacteria bacterium]
MRTVEGQFHIVFGAPAQTTLLGALRSTGRNETVIAFPDDLSVGPINEASPEDRAEWMAQHFGPAFIGEDDLPAETEAFWREFKAEKGIPTIWFSRRSVMEYSGFLHLVRILEEEPYKILDLSGTDVVKRKPVGPGKLKICLSLAEMRSEDAAAFLLSAESPAPALIDAYRRSWNELCRENAALRVLSDGGLVSAPISFFDEALLSAASADWQKISRVLGAVWARSFEDNALQVGEGTLASRVRALIAAGALECRGNTADLRVGEVRLLRT